jgi:hypothetical protein
LKAGETQNFGILRSRKKNFFKDAYKYYIFVNVRQLGGSFTNDHFSEDFDYAGTLTQSPLSMPLYFIAVGRRNQVNDILDTQSDSTMLFVFFLLLRNRPGRNLTSIWFGMTAFQNLLNTRRQ